MAETRGFRAKGVVNPKDLEAAMAGRRPAWVDGDGTIHVGGTGEAAPASDSGVTSFRPTTWGAVSGTAPYSPGGAMDSSPPSLAELGPEGSWQRKYWGRLRDEYIETKRRHPAMQLCKNADGTVSWVGPLYPFKEYPIIVELTYPACYPAQAPTAYILKPKLEPSPHRFANGALCLMHLSDTDLKDQNGNVVPSRTWVPSCTALTLVPLVSVWYGVYLVHRATCREESGKPCTRNGCASWTGAKYDAGRVVA